MPRPVSRFVCQECGYESVKWLGKCPACMAWNTIIEEKQEKRPTLSGRERTPAISLNLIDEKDICRFGSGIGELDRVLGGGIVPGSLILLGGDPGIGKSTLLLQVADSMASGGKTVLYLSGEESLKQIRLRSLRLGIDGERVFY
ncbi:AAA family ATPase [Syntrophomonas palmitatica]|uniref:AAA family ATPase n=1 Tax=Syntrophomonas palmitatica TaxID=402877 RepID=UPI000A5A73FD|nr:ATPase domain-containing protein [Syntrophomonas palmitatica]